VKGRADKDDGDGAKVIGIKCDADVIVDGKDQSFIPLTSVLYHCTWITQYGF